MSLIQRGEESLSMHVLLLWHFHAKLLIILYILSIVEFSLWKSSDSEQCLKITLSTHTFHYYLLTIVFAVKTVTVQFDS